MTIFNHYINYVDIIFVALFALSVFIGAKRGALITVINFIRYVVGFTLCVFLSNKFSPILYNNYMRPYFVKTVNEEVTKTNNIDEIIVNLNKLFNDIPKNIKGMFGLENFSLNESSDIATSIVDDVLQPIGLILSQAAIFLVVFVLFFGITGILVLIFNKNRKTKKLKYKELSKSKKASFIFDRTLGGGIGMIKGLMIILLLVNLVTTVVALAPNEPKGFLKEVCDSMIYKFIIDFNPFNLISEGIL